LFFCPEGASCEAPLFNVFIQKVFWYKHNYF